MSSSPLEPIIVDDRRAFFTRLFWGLAGLLGALVGIPVLSAFLSPAFKPREKAQWVAIGPANRFDPEPKLAHHVHPSLEGWVNVTGEMQVWVVRDQSGFRIFDNHCTHLGCPYHWEPSEQRFFCPCHNGIFSAQGKVLGPWKDIPLDLVVTPGINNVAKNLPTPPPGYNTNNFLTVGCCTLYIAGGRSLDGDWGVGVFDLVSLTAFVPGVPFSASEGTTDIRITKRLSPGDHSLVLGFAFTNKATGGDPYNTLYNNMDFPYISPVISVSTINPAISDTAGLLTSVYGMTLFAFYDESIYAQAGIYETWSTGALTFLNDTASSLGTISGSAPYLRLAYQHTWGKNFLEVGGMAMYIPLNQVPGVVDPTLQNQYLDWGFDATYQRTLGPDNFSVLANILFEQQTLGASLAGGLSANPSNSLTQFRLTASYYWHDTYGVTLGYIGTFGSTDTTLYAPAPLTGSANGSPNWQAVIAQVDWTPFGKSTTEPGYPWLNVRIGLQYTHYFQFNGGTTNYDGFGRNASDNDTLFLFTSLAF